MTKSHETSKVNLLGYRESVTGTRVRFSARDYAYQAIALDDVIEAASSIFSHWAVDWHRQSVRVIYEMESAGEDKDYLIEITVTENK